MNNIEQKAMIIVTLITGIAFSILILRIADATTTPRLEQPLNESKIELCGTELTRTLSKEDDHFGDPEYDNALINDYGSFGFKPGLDLTPPKKNLLSAASQNIVLSISDGIKDKLRNQKVDPNYDVIKDIPDRYLNVYDYKHFITCTNAAETAQRAEKLDRERENKAAIDNSKWGRLFKSKKEKLMDTIRKQEEYQRVQEIAKKKRSSERSKKIVEEIMKDPLKNKSTFSYHSDECAQCEDLKGKINDLEYEIDNLTKKLRGY